MAIHEALVPPDSPNKKRKVKVSPVKAWAKCTKPFFKDWRRDDYLLEFGMAELEWELLDVQVSVEIPHTLIVDEK
jgi:hypothetical protein